MTKRRIAPIFRPKNLLKRISRNPTSREIFSPFSDPIPHIVNPSRRKQLYPKRNAFGIGPNTISVNRRTAMSRILGGNSTERMLIQPEQYELNRLAARFDENHPFNEANRIKRAYAACRYKKGVSPFTECSICTDKVHPGVSMECTRCHKHSHKTCCQHWLNVNHSCPSCRYNGNN